MDELLSPEEIPFNLSGEIIDETPTAEGLELARIRSYYNQEKQQDKLDL